MLTAKGQAITEVVEQALGVEMSVFSLPFLLSTPVTPYVSESYMGLLYKLSVNS